MDNCISGNKKLIKDDRQTLKKILAYNLKEKEDLEEECQILLQLMMRKKLKNISECRILETTRKRRSEGGNTTDPNKKHSYVTNTTTTNSINNDMIKDQILDTTTATTNIDNSIDNNIDKKEIATTKFWKHNDDVDPVDSSN